MLAIASTRPARLDGIYVTALRTFSRNALSNPFGAQAPSRRRTMPFDIWSDLALTALCGTALIIWIGRDLAARARQRRA